MRDRASGQRRCGRPSSGRSSGRASRACARDPALQPCRSSKPRATRCAEISGAKQERALYARAGVEEGRLTLCRNPPGRHRPQPKLRLLHTSEYPVVAGRTPNRGRTGDRRSTTRVCCRWSVLAREPMSASTCIRAHPSLDPRPVRWGWRNCGAGIRRGRLSRDAGRHCASSQQPCVLRQTLSLSASRAFSASKFAHQRSTSDRRRRNFPRNSMQPHRAEATSPVRRLVVDEYCHDDSTMRLQREAA